MRIKFVVIGLFAVAVGILAMSVSPDLAIRRALLLRFQPVAAMTAAIERNAAYDQADRYQFVVTFADEDRAEKVPRFYSLQKNAVGCWHVVSSGWGP